MPPAWLDRLQRGSLLLTAVLYSAGYGTWGLVLLLLTSVLEGVTTRRLPWQRSRLDLLLVVFLLVFLLSGYLSSYRAIAVGSTGLAALTIYLAFGAAFGVISRDHGILSRLMPAWVAGGLAAAIWALIRYRQTDTAGATAVLGQNAVGTTLLIAFLLGLGLAAVPARPALRYILTALCVVLLAGLISTSTRGAWIGAAIGLALLILLEPRKVGRTSAIVALVALSGLLVFGSERDAFLHRLETITDPDLPVNRGRVFLYRTSLLMIADRPVIGTGLNTYALVYPQYQLPGDPNPLPLPFAHNMLLNMAVEGGMLGLAAFLAVLGGGLRAGWRWYRTSRDARSRTMAAVMLSALVGAMVHQLFDGTFISVHLGLGMWLLLGILTAGGTAPGERRTEREWTSA